MPAYPQNRISALVRPAVAAFIREFCLFITAYYLAYAYGMSFSQASASPFWFPDSILLCALLYTPSRRWWIFALATLPIRLFLIVSPNVPFWFIAATTFIDMGKGLISAAILRRFLKNPLRLDTVKDFSLFCLVAAVLVPGIFAFAGAAARHALGYDYWGAWQRWFMGDLLTQLVVTPAIMYWIFGWVRKPVFSIERCIEGAGLVISLILAGHLAFGTQAGGLDFAEARFYAPVPLLFWAAVRFGMFGASGAIMLLAFFSVGAAVHGMGPFLEQTPRETAFVLQCFLLLRAAPLYLVAVLIEQMKNTELELRQKRDELAHVARIAAMGELAASLAHELGQPLTAILNNAQAARRFLNAEPPDLKEVQNILTDIVHDDTRAGDVVRWIRSLIKKQKLSLSAVNIEEVVEDVLALLHSDLILRNVEVSYAFKDWLPSVNGDKIQLQQVVLNLLINAFEAMKQIPPDDRKVVIRARLVDARMIEISVQDCGIGLTDDQLKKMFESFYTTKSEGLGMGLSISQSIVEAHGGRLRAQNNPEGGATLFFTLPVVGSREEVRNTPATISDNIIVQR